MKDRRTLVGKMGVVVWYLFFRDLIKTLCVNIYSTGVCIWLIFCQRDAYMMAFHNRQLNL